MHDLSSMIAWEWQRLMASIIIQEIRYHGNEDTSFAIQKYTLPERERGLMLRFDNAELVYVITKLMTFFIRQQLTTTLSWYETFFRYFAQFIKTHDNYVQPLS